MNWDRIEGQWKQRRGKAVRLWGKVMNDELAGVAGRYEQLVGQLQERFGNAREEATEHTARFREIAQELKNTNRKLTSLLDSMSTVPVAQRPKEVRRRRSVGRRRAASPKRKKPTTRRNVL